MAIQEWKILSSISHVCSFHGLASFYRRFIRNFSLIMAPSTIFMKNKEFSLTTNAENDFLLSNRCLTEPHCLALLDFDKLFEVECDASNSGIGAVLSQLKHPKLSLAKSLWNPILIIVLMI